MTEATPGLAEADQRLIRSVDALPEDEYAAPSLLPGWSRAHVIAHLALNAEALTAVLRGAIAGTPPPMYPSQEQRDEDIAELALEPAESIRDRMLAGTARLAEAWEALTEEALELQFDRTPGHRPVAVADVGWMRHREVEIHHADLGLEHSARDWPTEFVLRLLESLQHRRPRGVTMVATDLDRRWPGDGPGSTVSGEAAELAWWLTGRPAGPTMRSDDGAVPGIEAW